MKSLLKALLTALTTPGSFDSGELLPTRRKAHLLYADMYARVAQTGEAEASRQPAPNAPRRSETTSRDVPMPNGTETAA